MHAPPSFQLRSFWKLRGRKLGKFWGGCWVRTRGWIFFPGALSFAIWPSCYKGVVTCSSAMLGHRPNHECNFPRASSWISESCSNGAPICQLPYPTIFVPIAFWAACLCWGCAIPSSWWGCSRFRPWWSCTVPWTWWGICWHPTPSAWTPRSPYLCITPSIRCTTALFFAESMFTLRAYSLMYSLSSSLTFSHDIA